MEGCPRSSMLNIDLKDSSPTEFATQLKKYISEHYQEDPESYKHECQQLEALRSTCLHPSHDHSGCSVLRKYFAQLQFLQSRFPMTDGGAVSVPFTWTDLYSEESITLSDIRFEQAAILHNLGALHSLLGGQEDRTSEEGMKIACTHFQAAAGVFQYLKTTIMAQLSSLKLPWVSEDHFAVPFFDLASCVLQLYINILLGQAQECLLEKSILDGRKDSLIARISMQVYDYYQQALGILESLGSSYMGSKKSKTWTKAIKIKACHFLCVSYVHMSNHANENQKVGEKVAYLKAASQKLTEAQKQSKGQPERTLELLQFMADVVGNKLEGAVKDNDFIYHEVVPDLATLPEIKGASLVKPIPFKPCDNNVSGPDIFQRLIPMEAHTDASIYSEEKAKLLRRYNTSVDAKNKQLAQSLASLHIDDLLQPEEADTLPSLLKDKHEALRKDAALLSQADQNIQESSSLSEEVENKLKAISTMLEEDEKKEMLIKEKLGPKPSPPERDEIKEEVEKCKDTLSKANQTNNELVRVYNAHKQNLELIAGPEEQLLSTLPSLNIIDSPVDDGAVQRLRDLIAKVEEMKKQRKTLEENLRKALNEDDITGLLVTREDGNKMAFFEEQLKKHDTTCSLIQANLDAQERILSALTEANAKYAKTRQAVKENSQRREEAVQALILSYNTFCELQGKLSRGVQFYQNLSKTVTKLEEKCKNFFDSHGKELDKLIEKIKSASEPSKPPSRPSAAKPDHLVRPQPTPLPSSMSGPRPPGPVPASFADHRQPATMHQQPGGFPGQFLPGSLGQMIPQGDARGVPGQGQGYMTPASSQIPGASSNMEQLIPRQGQQLPGQILGYPIDPTSQKQEAEKVPPGRGMGSNSVIPASSLHEGRYGPPPPPLRPPVPQTHIPADQVIHSTPRMSYPFPVSQEGTQVPGRLIPSVTGQNAPPPSGPEMQNQRLPFQHQNQLPPRSQPPHPMNANHPLHQVQQIRPRSPGQGPPQQPGIGAQHQQQMQPRFPGQENMRPQFLPRQPQFSQPMGPQGDPRQQFRQPHPPSSSQQMVFQRPPLPHVMPPTPTSSPLRQPFSQPQPRGPPPPQMSTPLQPQPRGPPPPQMPTPLQPQPRGPPPPQMPTPLQPQPRGPPPPQLPTPLQPHPISSANNPLSNPQHMFRAQTPMHPGQPPHPMQPQHPQEPSQPPDQKFHLQQQQQQQPQQSYHGQQRPTQSFQQPQPQPQPPPSQQQQVSQQQISSRPSQPLTPSSINQPQPYFGQIQNQPFSQPSHQALSPQQQQLPFRPDQPLQRQYRPEQQSPQPFRSDQPLQGQYRPESPQPFKSDQIPQGQFRPDQSFRMPSPSEQLTRPPFCPEQQVGGNFRPDQQAQNQLPPGQQPPFRPQQQFHPTLNPEQHSSRPELQQPHSVQTDNRTPPFRSDQLNQQSKPPIQGPPFRSDFPPNEPTSKRGPQPINPDGRGQESIPSQQQQQQRQQQQLPFQMGSQSSQPIPQQNPLLLNQATNILMSSRSYPETGAFLSNQPNLSTFPHGSSQARRPTPSLLQGNQGNRPTSVTSSDYLTSFSVALAQTQLSQYQSSASQQQTQQFQQQLLLQQQQLILQQQEMLRQQQTLQSHEHDQTQIGLLLQQILQQQKQLAELEIKVREKSEEEHEQRKDSFKYLDVQEQKPEDSSKKEEISKSEVSEKHRIHDNTEPPPVSSVNQLANTKKAENTEAANEEKSNSVIPSSANTKPFVPDYASMSQWFTNLPSNQVDVDKSKDSVDNRTEAQEDKSESNKTGSERSATAKDDSNCNELKSDCTGEQDSQDEPQQPKMDNSLPEHTHETEEPKQNENENEKSESIKEEESEEEKELKSSTSEDPDEARRREIEEQIKRIKEIQQQPHNQPPPQLSGYLYEPGKLPVVVTPDQNEHKPKDESDFRRSSDPTNPNEQRTNDETNDCRLYSDGPSQSEHNSSDETKPFGAHSLEPSKGDDKPSESENSSPSAVPNPNELKPVDEKRDRKPSFHRQCGHYYETQLSRLGHDANNTCLSDDESLQALISTVQGFDNVVKSLATAKQGTIADGFSMEWKELVRLQELDSASMATHAATLNQPKNRYRDILPWDHSRVKLQSKEDSDYINANFVKDVTPLTPLFIATQGPIATTLTDFWMMVWEQQSPLIIMLTKEVEGNRLMCHQYWPIDEGHTVLYGPIRVSLKTLHTNPSLVKRILHVQCNDSQDTLEVTHLQFTGWPDYGVPSSPADLLTFLDEVRSCYKQLDQEKREKPIVLHCSAGVGRTGTFIVIYAAIQEFDAHKVFVNIPRLVRNLRLQRKYMVQKKEQYEFCYKTILFYALQFLDLELSSIAFKKKASQEKRDKAKQVVASAPYLEEEDEQDPEKARKDDVFNEDPKDSRQKSSSVRFLGEIKSDDSLEEEDLSGKMKKRGESVTNEQSISEKYCQGTLETDRRVTKKRPDEKLTTGGNEEDKQKEPGIQQEIKVDSGIVHISNGDEVRFNAKEDASSESKDIITELEHDENDEKHSELPERKLEDHVDTNKTQGDHKSEIRSLPTDGDSEIKTEGKLLSDTSESEGATEDYSVLDNKNESSVKDSTENKEKEDGSTLETDTKLKES